jgi:tellurite resistance protein TehA-like permease
MFASPFPVLLNILRYTLATAMTIDFAIHDTAYLTPKSFSIGWTAYTFPIGVWATATISLAAELDSPALRIIAMVISLQVILQWMYVIVMTGVKAFSGTIFLAPELEKWDGEPPRRCAGEGRKHKSGLALEGV